MTARFLGVGLLVVAILQTAALAAMVVGHERDLARGQEVIVRSEMRDPRDFFRGNYTQLSLAINRLDRNAISAPEDLKSGMELYGVLEKGDDLYWTVTSLRQTKPEDAPAIRGRLAHIPPVTTDGEKRLIMDFPFSRYYAPERRALELEDLNRKGELGVILSVLDDGTAKIKGLTVGGEQIYDERLF